MPLNDPDTIVALVSTVQRHRDLARVVDELRAAEPHAVFDALWPIAVRSQGKQNGPVWASASILHALNAPCRVSLDAAVGSLLDQWEISIEEVPWYLAKQFGREAVLESLRRVMAGRDGDCEARSRVVQYWLGASSHGA